MDFPASLRVAIVGGGIGGLTLALVLSRMDLDKKIEVDIYESASELTQVGAGISVWPRTWEIWTKLGMDHDMAKYLPRYPDRELRLCLKFRKSDQKQGTTFSELFMQGGAVTFHRAEVQKTLLKEVPERYRCHLSHRFVSYQETEKEVVLTFQDGSVATCDLLIGADGIKSAVRKSFILDKYPEEKDSIEPIFTGTMIYRGLYDSKILSERMPGHRSLTTPMVYCGKSKHVVSYPISQGTLINIGAFYSDLKQEGTIISGPTVEEASKEEMMDHYTTWESEVQVLLEGIEKPSRWATQSVRPLKSYASGRVILIGDSAHGMPPHLGAGAGQAIEDAYILGTILCNASRDRVSLSRASEIFTSVRQPVGNFAMDSARTLGLLFEFSAPGFEDIEGNQNVPPERLEEAYCKIEKLWRWGGETSAEVVRAKALELLQV